jgi:hypothetical protein
MCKLGWAVVSLGCAFGASGCFFSAGPGHDDDDGGGDSASVSIDDFSIEPTTVNDGDTFVVTWRVAHTSSVGYITQMGLYMGGESDLETTSARDSRSLFSLAVTAGVPSDPSSSTMSCTRTGANLRCDTTGGSTRSTSEEEAQVTFRACNSYVLDTEEVCEMRSLLMTFP